jgi:GGDEF domain-containing protein
MGPKTITAVTSISKVSGKQFARASAVVVISGEELGRKYDLEEGKTVVVRFDGAAIPVTISCGTATLAAKESDDAQALIARADEKLYEAKESGRNRVC